MKNGICILCAGLMLGLFCGCGQAGRPEAGQPIHARDPMISHIWEEHGLRIGAETNADIIIASTTGNAFTVVLTPQLLKRLPSDFLPVLKLDGAKCVLTEAEYDRFLENLHDYLLVTYGEGVRLPSE